MRVIFTIFCLTLLLLSFNNTVIAAEEKISIVRVQTVLRDTRGRTLSDAFCVVYNRYGLPFNLRTNSRGEALLEGHPNAVLRCIRQKQAYEAKMPTGEPSQILMRPLGGGECFVYNALPLESSFPACVSEPNCDWSGWGPYGACSEIPKKE